MKNKIKFIFGIFLLVTLMGNITAFGVSSPYWTGNPLNIDRGETMIVELNLQNMVGDDDVNVEARLVSGSEYAKLKETQFLVKQKTSDTFAPLTIKIPRNVEPGIHKIKVEFKSIADDTGGMINVGTGMDVSFDVNISENFAKREINYILIGGIVLTILIIILIIFLTKRKKKKRK